MAEEPKEAERQEGSGGPSSVLDADEIGVVPVDADEFGAVAEASPPPVPVQNVRITEREHAEPKLANVGVSQIPPPPAETVSAVAAAVARLRAEVNATDDKPRKARLLNEAGEIQERGGDETAAARDYLAAYNADTNFREPLEGLVRLLERRRSLANLGKLIEALVVAASTPEERARALTQRAIFSEDVQKDLEGARGAAREATETGAPYSDLGPAWLALEMVSAKLGDSAQREEALAGRAELTDDPTWRGLLLTDTALLAAGSGEIDRALSVLSRAQNEGGAAAYAATTAIERVLLAEPGLPGSDDARTRGRTLAEALESRAEMIRSAILAPETGDAHGVPSYVRRLEYVIDLFVRAADARRAASELGRAAQVLDRALAIVAEAMPTNEDEPTSVGEAKREAAVAMERLVLTARLRLAEAAGDTALAADLADRRIVGETDGGVAASLAMRIAEHAASEGDIPRALEALTRATERDPASAPARALKADILEGSGDHAGFATEIEDLARRAETDDARGRHMLLAAFVWATRAESAARAREALAQASSAGVPPETIARVGRTLASLRSDHGWYEEATRALVEVVPTTSSELPLLWVELARIRLGHGDENGAGKATAALRELPEGVWLGRVLDGLASPDIEPSRARSALEELTADTEDATLRRSLGIVCALRARSAGDEAAAVAHLEKLAKEDPSDPLVQAYLGDLFRLANNRSAAAALATSTAEAITGDDELAAAKRLEAGLETWRLGDRAAAVAHFEAAAELAPEAAKATLSWAARGVDVDSIEGRRRAIELAGSDAAVQLERFALEATSGDPDAAEDALASVEIASDENLRLAATLGRLAWPKGLADADALDAALGALATVSDATTNAGAAERLRFAREDGVTDPEGVASAARAWLDVGGGAAAAIEWLASTLGSATADSEALARRALADLSSDEAKEALQASATLLEWAIDGDRTYALVTGSSPAVRLANLELSPPGCDPRRRAGALSELDGALGEETDDVAASLAAWSVLATGDASAALERFRAVTKGASKDDLHAWEGMRAAAEELGNHEAYAVACEQIGARCTDDARGAAFWEQAALAWLQLGAAHEMQAEAALDASFARDATRKDAFNRLFRRVRDKKEHDRLLALIERRLGVTEDAEEIAKLYWEQARVLREKGDPDGALEALEHVVMFDENHVGALALTGEIFIRRGQFEDAAAKLSKLAHVEGAPPKNRVTAGVAAVDLYENKLGRNDLALEVLLTLHRAKLTTLPVRERLARAAARTGSWTEATSILEELMIERPERAGRIEAARLAMAIHRDKLSSVDGSLRTATKILDESATDGEALDLILGLDSSVRERRRLLERGRDALLMSLHDVPSSVDNQARLARIASDLGDEALEQSALSCVVALAGPDGITEEHVAGYLARKVRLPSVVLTDSMLRQILASGDDGPLADLFAALGPTLGEALGPSRDSLGVGRRDRVDAKSGTALRTEIAQWAGAFGVTQFDLYVGGKDASTIQALAGEDPAIVVGADVKAPLSTRSRARLASELLALVRGTNVMRWRDDTTIQAIIIAACNLAKVKIDAPPLAVLADVERLLGKALGRKTRAAIEPICRAANALDSRAWAARARASQARAAALAAGDVSTVLSEILGDANTRDDLRAHELYRFVLSRPYFDLRRSLGLEEDA